MQLQVSSTTIKQLYNKIHLKEHLHVHIHKCFQTKLNTGLYCKKNLNLETRGTSRNILARSLNASKLFRLFLWVFFKLQDILKVSFIRFQQ